MKKVLQGLQHRDAYTRQVTLEIVAWMRDAIFAPLQNLLRNSGVTDEHINAAGIAIEQALNSGQIHYAAGAFTGSFNAAISRELQAIGAKWQVSSRSWQIPIDSIPYELRGAIAASAELSKKLHADVIGTLGTIEQNVAVAAVGLNLAPALAAITKDLAKQSANVFLATDVVGVQAEVSAAQRALLDQRLTANLELSIKNFAEEMIPDLRAQVEKNLFDGARTGRLADIIEARYGVSQRKAAFLADQETGLLTAKYAQIQAEEIGSTEYVWSTSADERVRPDHAALDGKRFSYASPPITNRATGDRNNPGEDFRCRCVAKPIINLPSA